jgi:hypothetical protein
MASGADPLTLGALTSSAAAPKTTKTRTKVMRNSIPNPYNGKERKKSRPLQLIFKKFNKKITESADLLVQAKHLCREQSYQDFQHLP